MALRPRWACARCESMAVRIYPAFMYFRVSLLVPIDFQAGGSPLPMRCCGAAVLCVACAREDTGESTYAVHTHAVVCGVARVQVSPTYAAVFTTSAVRAGDLIATEPACVMSASDDAHESMTSALALSLQHTTLCCTPTMGAAELGDPRTRLLKLKLSQMKRNMFRADDTAVLFDFMCRVNHRCVCCCYCCCSVCVCM